MALPQGKSRIVCTHEDPMTRLAASLITSAVVLGLAACADSPTEVVAPVGLQPMFSVAGENAHIHVMPTKSMAQEALARVQMNAARRKGGGGTGIFYHSGPILYTTNVAAIYWANDPIYTNGPTPGASSNKGGAPDNSLVGDFLAHLGGSAYFNINTTYYDRNNVHVQNAVNYTQYWANNTSVPADGATVTDAQMLSMLQAGIAGGDLVYDPNTVYNIFTAGKVNLGGGFGTQYCAYHGQGTIAVGSSNVTVLYSAMPYDYAYPSACTSGLKSPNGDAGANYEVNTLAHEVEETTTDGFGNAWYDLRGYENADKCAWTWGTTYTVNGGVANMNIAGFDYLVQRNWVNSGNGGCALHL
jgi:Phosphate-induced protein 1 conserved region